MKELLFHLFFMKNNFILTIKLHANSNVEVILNLITKHLEFKSII